MSYRDELAGVLRRCAELEERLRTAERRAAGVPPSAPERRRLGYVAALVVLCTFTGYAIVLACFDGQPPDPSAEMRCAFLGAAAPVLVSARVWWLRQRDDAWWRFFALRAAAVAFVWRGPLWRISHFGHDFVFFWWGPSISVALLLVELALAARVRRT